MSIWNLKCSVGPFKFPLCWGSEEMTYKSFLLQLFSSTGRQNSRIPKAKFLFGHVNSTSRSCIWMILILRGNFFRWKFTFQVNFFRFKTKICQRLSQFWVLSRLMLELVSCYSILYGFWWYFRRNWNLSFYWIYEDLQSCSFFDALIFTQRGV